MRTLPFVLAAVLLAFAVVLYEGLAFKDAGFSLARRCCDGAFVSAVLFLSLGGLAFVSRWGGFDALSYALISFTDIFRRPENRRGKGSYFDYVQAKQRGRMQPALRLLAVGAGMLAAALAIQVLPSCR